MTEKLLEELAGEARRTKPRLFAICGVYQHTLVEGEDPRYVEWGMEFTDERIAITCDQNSKTTASSAEHILSVNKRMGPAQLVWLDD